MLLVTIQVPTNPSPRVFGRTSSMSSVSVQFTGRHALKSAVEVVVSAFFEAVLYTVLYTILWY